jgi:hypothetical protein
MQKGMITMGLISYRVDDLDGKTKVTGDATELTLNGKSVTIDLGTKNAAELAALLKPYFDAGVAVTRKTRTSNAAATPTDKDHNTAVREWAAQNGHQVSDKGRLSKAVLEAYEATQGHASVEVLEAALNGQKTNA